MRSLNQLHNIIINDFIAHKDKDIETTIINCMALTAKEKERLDIVYLKKEIK